MLTITCKLLNSSKYLKNYAEQNFNIIYSFSLQESFLNCYISVSVSVFLKELY